MSHSGRPKVDQMPCTSITLLPRYKMIREFDRICFQVSSVKRSASNRFKSSGRGIPELLIQREDMLQKIKATLRIRLWMNSTWTTQHAWIIMNHQPPTHQSINSEQNHRESGTLSSTMVPMFLRPLNDSDSLRPSSFILVLARVLGFVRSRRSSTTLALKSKDVGIEPLKWRS